MVKDYDGNSIMPGDVLVHVNTGPIVSIDEVWKVLEDGIHAFNPTFGTITLCDDFGYYSSIANYIKYDKNKALLKDYPEEEQLKYYNNSEE